MKKLIIIAFSLLVVAAFGNPRLPKREDIEWLQSYTPKVFETLCVQHQDDSPFALILYPSQEILISAMKQFPETDEIRKWKVKDSAYEENGRIWTSGWALFAQDRLVKLFPLNTTHKANKTI